MESKKLTGIPALSYIGVEALTPPDLIILDRSPTIDDFENINIGTLWLVPSTDQINNPADAEIWILADIVGLVATWVKLYPGGSGVGATQFITDNGTANQAGGILNVPGDPNITTSGAGNTVTIDLNNSISILGPLTVTSLGAGVVQTDAGGLFFSDNGTDGQILIGGGTEPNWATITAGANITIVNAANSITINSTAASPGATTFHTDSGDAVTVANAITIAGGSNINTSGAASTVTINLDNTVSISGSWTAGTTITAGTGLTVSAFGAGVVQTNSSGVFFSNKGLDGQTLISATAGVPAWANLTSTGGSVTITNGPNTINLEAAGVTPPGGSTAFLAGYWHTGPGQNIFGDVTAGLFVGLGNHPAFFNIGSSYFVGQTFPFLPAVFTAPVTGLYCLCCQVSIRNVNTSWTEAFDFWIVTSLSGSPIVYAQSNFEFVGPGGVVIGIFKVRSNNILIPLDAGATVMFYVRAFLVNNATPQFYSSIVPPPGINMWMSGFRVA
jgi:hypothetical protein